jgi:hypothetical protein
MNESNKEELREQEEIEEELELFDDDCFEDCKKCLYATVCTRSTYRPPKDSWQYQEWAKWE